MHQHQHICCTVLEPQHKACAFCSVTFVNRSTPCKADINAHANKPDGTIEAIHDFVASFKDGAAKNCSLLTIFSVSFVLNRKTPTQFAFLFKTKTVKMLSIPKD